MGENQYKNIIVEIDKGIAVVSINRPEVRNALNSETYKELSSFMSYAEDSDDVKVVILTGSGEKAFVSGADLGMLQVTNGVRNLKSRTKEVLQQFEQSGKVVIAAINGVAFGGGFELALACDIRIISKNAKLGLPETGLGLMPGAGGTQRLSRLCGIGVAKDIILAGRIITGDEAVGLGLAMKCVELDSLIEDSKNVAKEIIRKGPLAIRLAKRAIDISLDIDKNSGLLLENWAFSILLDSKDKAEGVAAFLEKRPPTYTGE